MVRKNIVWYLTGPWCKKGYICPLNNNPGWPWSSQTAARVFPVSVHYWRLCAVEVHLILLSLNQPGLTLSQRSSVLIKGDLICSILTPGSSWCFSWTFTFVEKLVTVLICRAAVSVQANHTVQPQWIWAVFAVDKQRRASGHRFGSGLVSEVHAEIQPMNMWQSENVLERKLKSAVCHKSAGSGGVAGPLACMWIISGCITGPYNSGNILKTAAV